MLGLRFQQSLFSSHESCLRLFPIQKLVSDLDRLDLETAARTSYAYWWYVTQTATSTTTTLTSEQCDDEQTIEALRIAAAQREARRHYVGNNRDVEKAKASLLHAIQLRQKYHVDLLRWMGVQETPERPPLDEDEKERLVLYRKYIADELEKQMTAVVGLDEEDRAMILKGSRTNRDTDIEGYLILQIYVAERAMALTEVASRGRQERIFVIFDFAAYNSQHAPPALELRGALADLQALYKERLHQLVILDPPFFLNLLYNIISPFLDTRTREKVRMASGAAERARVVTASPQRQEALACLLQKDEDYNVSVETFLHKISFHEYYNLTTPPIAALS